MRQASPAELSAGTPASFDWQATALGPHDAWPAPLRLCIDIMMNTPLPMLLAWGDAPVVVINDAYAGLSGQPAPVAGCDTPLMAACADALAQARGGATVRLAGHPIHISAVAGGGHLACNVCLTPVRGDSGQVAGVLAALGACSVQEAPAAAPAGGLRILVVEDNLDSQYLVCEMLKAFGHHADGVGDAEAALGMLNAANYDVLFSDVSLPGMSGVELARQGLVIQPSMHVIFASGYGDTLLRHLPFPFVSLQKPYEMEQLQGTLDELARKLGR
jgi:CheY-like chemotaxis protein